MRAFIVLCLVAVACADKLGYNYQPVGHSDGGLSFSPGSGGSGGLGGFGGSSDLGGSRGGSGFGGNNGGAGHFGNGDNGVGNSFGGDHGAGSSDSPSYSAPGGDLDKEFFTYTADENDFNDPAASEQVANSLKQSLRVVFIKGPENSGLENAALQLAKSASEDKTAIYVLNKQADIADLANKLNAIRSQSNSNKPEVHFVKYRTPEDAANAQNQIQGQYDSLGGSSQSHNGGVAPVHNFASRAPVDHSHHAASAPGASYLPASIFRRFRL